MASLAFGIALTMALACTPHALAGGCTQWLPGPMTPPILGTNGPVFAALKWTPIGQTPLLIIGGQFTQVGGAEVSNIAAWDGKFWRALGNGTNGPVRSLAVFNNQLIAGGEFTSPGRRIATWNGSTWAGMGDFGPPETGGQDGVQALEVFNGSLYAGGYFCCVNGASMSNNCARYLGGTSWTEAAGMIGVVRALQVFDQDGVGPLAPVLYIGGVSYLGGQSSFRRSTDGVNATNISGPSGPVHCMAVVDELNATEPGGLLVGGQFVNWVNGGSPTQVRNIARYDGTSGHVVGGGLGEATDFINAIIKVDAVGVCAGGKFIDHTSANTGIYNIARYVSSRLGWQFPGVNFGSGGILNGYAVHALTAWTFIGSDDVVVGGEFTGVFGELVSNNIARCDQSSWLGFNESLIVRAQAVIGTRLVVGGQFSQSVPSGGTTHNPWNIMAWDGAAKSSLGLGTNNTVRSLLAYTTGSGPSLSNVVIAGGDFTTVYGDGLNPAAPIAANRIAQWTEPSLGLPTWSPMGQGFDAPVRAIERFAGNVVAGGEFQWTGLTNINRLAKWTGSPPSWQPLTTPAPNFDGPVYALKAFTDALGGNNSYLVIGGSFGNAPGTGVTAHSIVLRVESPIAGQSAWQALGAGFSGGPVFAIERFGSGLNARTYAAGGFTSSGTTTCNRIARLNGANWEAVGIGGAGGGFNGTVYALRSSGGFLYAAGDFTSVDGIPANRIARWNGSVWSAVEGGVGRTQSPNAYIYALANFRGEIVAGGDFDYTSAPVLVTPALARFTPTNIPWIARQPAAATVACGSTAAINLAVAPGYLGLTYGWRRNAIPLSDGVTANGSTISGATTATLSISGAQPEDAGSYDCVVTCACGFVTSTAVALTITGNCCPADINADGQVNVTDLLAVIGAWGTAGANPADVNGDNVVNVTDLLAVIGAWGACP